jgi:hypothetical protein
MSTHVDQQVNIPVPTPPSKRRLARLAGVAAAVIAVAAVIVVATAGGTVQHSRLAFSLPKSGPGRSSCVTSRAASTSCRPPTVT